MQALAHLYSRYPRVDGGTHHLFHSGADIDGLSPRGLRISLSYPRTGEPNKLYELGLSPRGRGNLDGGTFDSEGCKLY